MQTRKTLMISAAAAALAMTAPAANAASSYVSLFGGASFLNKLTAHGHIQTVTTMFDETVSSSFKTGFVVGGDYGIDWGTFRTEFELGVRQNSASKAKYRRQYVTYYGSGTVNQSPNVDLNLRSYSLMANAWYDFHDILPSGITPYVGGGLGLSMVQLDGKWSGTKLHESNSTQFAWQVGAGVAVPVTESIKLTADYRYADLGKATVNVRPTGKKLDLSGDVSGHSVFVGLRIGL